MQVVEGVEIIGRVRKMPIFAELSIWKVSDPETEDNQFEMTTSRTCIISPDAGMLMEFWFMVAPEVTTEVTPSAPGTASVHAARSVLDWTFQVTDPGKAATAN